jgi:hypothetical protein
MACIWPVVRGLHLHDPGNQSCFAVSLIPNLSFLSRSHAPLLQKSPKCQQQSPSVALPFIVGLLAVSGAALGTTELGASQVQYQRQAKQLTEDSTALTQSALALQQQLNSLASVVLQNL